MADTVYLYLPKLQPGSFQQFRNVVPVNGEWDVTALRTKSFMDTIPGHEQQLEFCQKVNTGDELDFVFAVRNGSGYTPGCKVYYWNGRLLVDETSVLNLYATYTDPDSVVWDYYRVNIDTSAYPDGVYNVTIYAEDTESNNVVWISEPIWVKTSHKDTAVIGYSNDKNDFDVIFSALPENFYFVLRVDGGWESNGFAPKAKDTIFMDEFYNSRLLDSVPYEVKTFTFGRSEGVPNWQAGIINRILACNITYIDGVRYVKADGAKLERNGTDLYPMAGWRIELMEYNTYSSQYKQIPKIIGHGVVAIGHETAIVLTAETE